jgi:hypothetical protein
MKRLKGPNLKRLKGPDLKLPNRQLPPFLSDLLFDLRDRGLLPLVVLIVVAIAAVPFLLGSDSAGEGSYVPPVQESSVGRSAGAAESSVLDVVAANPGLRDYRKRLRRRSPTNPFKQRYTAPPLTGTQLPPETTSTSSTTSTTTTETSSSEIEALPPSSGGTLPSTGGGDGSQPKLTYFTFAIDVKLSLIRGAEASDDGGMGSSGSFSAAEASGDDSDGAESQPAIRHGVTPAMPLPGKKAPTITYMGAIDNATTALFLISTEVTSITGDGKCLSGSDSCQLLGMKVGGAETFVYGANHNRLKISVLKIEPVVTGHS